jgi:hypothetical protein
MATTAVSCGERVLVAESTGPNDSTVATEVQLQTTTIDSTVVVTTPATPETVVPTTTQTPSDTTIAGVDQTAPPAENPATEHQLAVLAAAFAMPGRPDLADSNGGQHEIVGSRELAVNVPIRDSWQYADLDAQNLPPASKETSEIAARFLLARLGIEPGDETPTFTQNGPSIDIGLGGCLMRFAEDGQVAWAIGGIGAIAAS